MKEQFTINNKPEEVIFHLFGNLMLKSVKKITKCAHWLQKRYTQALNAKMRNCRLGCTQYKIKGLGEGVFDNRYFYDFSVHIRFRV